MTNIDIDLNTLVLNIVAENRYSHCRLCLSLIQEHYLRLSDAVSLDPKNGIFQPLKEVLVRLLGDVLYDEIVGIDAICTKCAEKVVEAAKFIEKCHRSTELVQKVFNNVSNSLNVNLDTNNKEHALCIVVEEDNSKLFWMEKEPSKRKIGRGMKVKDLACQRCNKLFDSFFYLKSHNLTYHDTLTCEKCYETFLNESELTSHDRNEHKYKCSECHQSKHSEEALKEHEERLHNIIVCKECGKSCCGLDKLRMHEEKHNSKYTCPKSGKTYTTKDFYVKHVSLCLKDLLDPHPTRSSIKKIYTCDKCSKGYSTAGGLRVHNRFVHGNAEHHVCKECGKHFTAPSYLRNHMIKHTGEKNFVCDLCGSRFVTKRLSYTILEDTQEKNHTVARSAMRVRKFKHVGPTLMCEICPRKFVMSYFLKQHMSRHHDPSSKYYYARNMVPPNMPSEQNMGTF